MKKDSFVKRLFNRRENAKVYKKKDITFPMETNHPRPYLRNSRYEKKDIFWINSNNNDSDKATILCGGDLMCEPKMSEAAYIDGEYDFRPSFKYIRPILKEADLTIANLETIVSDKFPYAREAHRVPHHTGTRYHCNAPREYLDALRYAGFDALALANNHNLDGGYDGIVDTLDNLDDKNFMHTGLFKSSDEERILFVNVNSINIAILSYTEHINRNLDKELLTEKGRDELINCYSKEKVKMEIEVAKNKGAEFVIVYIHFLGKEYSHEIVRRQTTTAQEIADSGADCIMGSHMHCIQKYSTVVSNDGRRVPVTYSLGNLMTSDNTGSLTKRTFLYKLILKKQNNKVLIDKEYYIPLRIVEGTLKSSYTIFPTQLKYREKESVFFDDEQALIEQEVGNDLMLDLDDRGSVLELKKSDVSNNDYYARIVNGNEVEIYGARKKEIKRIIPKIMGNNLPVRYIGKEAFSGAVVEKLFLPDNIRIIGYAAFYNCSKLETVNLGNELEVIERSAFNNCTSLKEILLPTSLKTIGERAFMNTGLSNIYIPDSVDNIADDAFYGCSNLTIHCSRGSYTEKYAKKMAISINYTMLKSQPIDSSYSDMKPQISISEVCKLLDLEIPKRINKYIDLDIDSLRNVSITSWSVKQGDIAILNEGNLNYEEAMKKGASMIISENDCGHDIAYSVVLPSHISSKDAYIKICRAIREKYHIPCITITGNAGKTTTKDLIGRTMSCIFNTLYVNKNFNTYYTAGEIIQNLSNNHEMYVQEVHEPHAEYVSYETNPNVVVLTNLERAHLDETGSSIEDSIKATLNVLKYAKPDATIIANNDCKYLSKEEFKGFKVIRYSSINNDNSDYWAEKIVNYADRATFMVCSKNDDPFELEINVPGIHNVTNAVGAYAVGRLYGIPKEDIKFAIGSYMASGIRQNLITLDNRSILIDCYSITPLSLVAAAKTICELPTKENGKKILVVSYLPTLSKESERVHREVAQTISKLPLDLIIGYRNDSKYLVDECQKNGKKAYFFQYHKEVIEFLKENLTNNDNILFKGGTASHLEQIANTVFNLNIKSENTLDSDRKKNGGDY